MLTPEGVKRLSLAGKKSRVHQQWTQAWDEAFARLPEGDGLLAVIHAFEYPRWNGMITEGEILWFGDLLLTTKRIVLVSPNGTDQIRISDIGGADYREFRMSLFKKTTTLLLTSGARVDRIFSTGEDTALAREFADRLTELLSGRQAAKFED